MPSAEKKLELRFWYFKVATHYYIAGRYAHIGRLIPTAGNLFHHAIEMYLKGYLALELNNRELKKFRHSLRRIWQRVKDSIADLALDKFNTTIEELDNFEDIRYPEKIAQLGVFMHFDIIRLAARVPATTWANRVGYELPEIDNLVATIFEKSGANPVFFITTFLGSEDAKAYLRKDNPMKQVWGL